jgi:phosphoglycolate phosphatase
MQTPPSPNRRFDLVMFDLDGTLVDTAGEMCDAVNDTLQPLDLPSVSQQQLISWIGQGTHELLIQAVAHCTQTDCDAVRASPELTPMLDQFALHYQNRCGTRSQLYPQVKETLLGLQAQGVKLAVVTNKEARYTRAILQAHQLTALFDTVISGDSLPTKKPEPDGIYHCLSAWGVPPERALLVGDSSIDAAAARHAGVQVWLLPYGYNRGQPVAHCAPDRVIADISVLLKE